MNMQETKCNNEIWNGIERLPVSPLLVRAEQSRYGSVAGLSDNELADPDEIERVVMAEQWAPMAGLSAASGRRVCRALSLDWGDSDPGAFGTVDFERLCRPPDSVGPTIFALKEKLKDTRSLFHIVRSRLPRQANVILNLLERGVLSLEHIANEDMLALAKLYLRARNTRVTIAELNQARQGRQWLPSIYRRR